MNLNHFCVLEPVQEWGKTNKRKGSVDWPVACTQRAGKEAEMESERSFKTAVCNTYERLLQRCMAKSVVWASRRHEFCEGSGYEEGGAELLRLQADYAKSYNDLCKHVGSCEICKFFSSKDHGDQAKDSKLLYMRGSSD